MRNILQKLNRFFKNNCYLAVLDEDKGRWIIKPEPKNIPYLKAENAHGRHILIKPTSNIEPYYLLVDDLNINQIACHHQLTSGVFKYGRMVVETSPGNYQVWIHSDRALPLDEKRYWLKRLHNDPGADPNNRWGRCPGFRNRKEKHRTASGQYPLARVVWIDWKHCASIPKITLNISSENPFSHPPGVKCVIKIILPVLTMKKEMNRSLILPMPWLFFAEDSTRLKSHKGFWLKGRCGIIMPPLKRKKII